MRGSACLRFCWRLHLNATVRFLNLPVTRSSALQDLPEMEISFHKSTSDFKIKTTEKSWRDGSVAEELVVAAKEDLGSAASTHMVAHGHL